MSNGLQHVFIIGSKGIPANYGGFESFVEKLTEYRKNKNIKYHVACLENDDSEKGKEFCHNDAHCFTIKPLNIGPAKAIFYDLQAFDYCLDYIKKITLILRSSMSWPAESVHLSADIKRS